MDTLLVAALSLDIQWKNKQENFSTIERKWEEVIADLFILPEMFCTGFCMDAEEIADTTNEVLSWMQSFAHKKGAAVAGSVSVKDKGNFYNRFYFVKPDSSYEYYDKRHLFSYSGEDKVYTPGNERKIIEYKGFRLLLQICYDLRFPVFSRNNNDYDVAIYVANWPDSRVQVWTHLLKARALENQAFVIGINRIGKDGNQLNYTESSACFFADGTEISEKNNTLLLATIQAKDLNDFRAKFQFLNDRDDFKLNF